MKSWLRRGLRGAALRGVGLLAADPIARCLARAGSIRVLNLHGTPHASKLRLRELLRWTRDRYDVLSPLQFGEIVRGRAYQDRGVLFTFDDGLRSNYDVAAAVLEELGMRGLFFVNPRFAETEPGRWREFFATRIRTAAPSRHFTPEDYTPMLPRHIADLAARGHEIGSHTASHARLSELPPEQYSSEIVDSGAKISEWAGRPCQAFAWTFAWNAISVPAWRCIGQHYDLCFSACPSQNQVGRINPQLIFRTNVESTLSLREYKIFVNGLADLWWQPRRRVLERMHAHV